MQERILLLFCLHVAILINLLIATTTAFTTEAQCNTSWYSQTYINGTCYTFVTFSGNYDQAMKKCTEFDDGHLVYPYYNLGNILQPKLYSLPEGTLLFVGLRQFPRNSSDEPNKEWYYVMSDNTTTQTVAAALPWNTYYGEPILANDCGAFGYTGGLRTVNCSSSPGYLICEYGNGKVIFL
uniref:C-type lectin domain-containing protein n=1 Tax=Plectus sambesii TaxID=2011161 RepID=A0A914UQE5_9BILA